ncbi:MAG TPA: phosphoribosylformylglycinamidine synthase I, partial [Deltaproteobacteria bacterium]|nr:phosphoribosylformylglycinamidine synthase I [Deltaproteobacteria bacterium]
MTLKLNRTDLAFTNKGSKTKTYRIPIAHMEGNYFIDDDGLKKLKDNGQIIFQYANAQGEIVEEANPNGARANIAGICNPKGNILGMMPHP